MCLATFRNTLEILFSNEMNDVTDREKREGEARRDRGSDISPAGNSIRKIVMFI